MFNDIDHNFKTLDAARKYAVNNKHPYKTVSGKTEYWTVSTIYYGTVSKSGKHAGNVYLPGWVGFKTDAFVGIWIPVKSKGQAGVDLNKARFVNRDGTLGSSATAFVKANRRY